MEFLNDFRQEKDPLGYSSQSKKNFIDYISEQISLNLANSTPSNYNFQNYGSNQRIIFESVAKIIANIFIDISDFEDDSSFSDLRPEFISSKLLSLVFEDESIPNIKDTENLRNLCREVVSSLLSGSTEPSILSALESTKDGDLIELRKISQHIISIYSSTIKYTGNPKDTTTVKHRHIVHAKSNGVGSTSAPIGKNWGEELHYHEVIDGVVQPYNGHTHEVELGISSTSLEEQENLRKVLKTTKPAHLKIGDVSSVLAESVTSPRNTTINFKKENNEALEIIPQTSEDFIFALGSSHQENMRKVRAGTWENVVLGYYKDQRIRVSTGLVNVLDNVSIAGKVRKVVEVSEINIEDGNYVANILRQNKTINISVSNGFISVDETIGNNEVFEINGDGYFVEKRARGIAYLRAKEIRLASPVSVVAGLNEISFLDLTWKTTPLKYRKATIKVREHNGFFYSELNTPQRKTFKGVPILKEDLSVDSQYTILEYYPYFLSIAGISNKIVLKFAPDNLVEGKEIEVLTPLGEDDLINFTDLNSEQFVLNASRNTRRSKALTSPTKIANKSKSNSKSSPTIGIFPTLPIEPKNVESFKAEATAQGTHGLNTFDSNDISNPQRNQLLVGVGSKYNSHTHFTLNKYNRVSSNVTDIKDYARATVNIFGGLVSFNTLGFRPDYIISVKDSDLNEYESEITHRGLKVFGVSEGLEISVVSISSTPYKKLDWAKGDILSEGQSPFDFLQNTIREVISTPEEIMRNPQGRVLDTSDFAEDKQRLDLYRKQVSSKGVEAEEIFYEDDLTRMEIKGHPFIRNIQAIKSTVKVVRPSLTTNDTNTLIGIRSILNRREVLEGVGLKIKVIPKADIDQLSTLFFGVFLEDEVVVNDNDQEEFLIEFKDDLDVGDTVNLNDNDGVELEFNLSLEDIVPLIQDEPLIIDGDFVVGEILEDTTILSDNPLETIYLLTPSDEDVGDTTNNTDEEVDVEFRFIVPVNEPLVDNINPFGEEIEVRFPVVGVSHTETLNISDEMEEEDLVTYLFTPISEEDQVDLVDEEVDVEFQYLPIEVGGVGEEETVDVQEDSATAFRILEVEVDDPASDTLGISDEELGLDYNPTLILSVQMDERMADYDFTITIYRVPSEQNSIAHYYKLDYPQIQASDQTSFGNQKPVFEIRNPTWDTTVGNDFRIASITGTENLTTEGYNYYNNGHINGVHVIDLYVGNDSENPILLDETYYLLITTKGENKTDDSSWQRVNFRVSMQMVFKPSSQFNLGLGTTQDNMGVLKGNYVELWESEQDTTQFILNTIPGTNRFNYPDTRTKLWSFQTTPNYDDRENGVAPNVAGFNPNNSTPARLPFILHSDLTTVPIDHTQIYPVMPARSDFGEGAGVQIIMNVGMFLNFTQSNSDMYVYIEEREPTSDTGYNVIGSVNGQETLLDPNLNFQDFPTPSNQVTLKSELSPYTGIVPPVEFNLHTNRHYHISVSDPDNISLHLETRSKMPNPDEEYTTYTQNSPPPLVNFNTLTNNTNSFLFYIRSDGKIYIK